MGQWRLQVWQPASALSTQNLAYTAYLADCKNYNKNTGLDFGLPEASKRTLLAPLSQDLLSAPASQANIKRVFLVCGDLAAGKSKSPDKESGESGIAEDKL